MKKITLTLIFFSITYFSYSQNIFPNNGNAGILTQSPVSTLTLGVSTAGMQSNNGITLGVGQNNIEFLNSIYGAGFGAKIYGVDSGSGITTLRIATRGNSTTWKDALTITASSGINPYVGIGIVSPLALLHAVVPVGKTSTSGNVVSFLSTNETSAPFGLRTMIYGASAIANRYVALQTTDYASVDGGNIILQSATGNVGIGTVSPYSKLHVSGTLALGGSDANLDPNIPSRSPSFLANTGQMYVGWNRTGGGGETDLISNQGGGGTGGFAFYNYSNSGTESQLMWIQANGNVAIGTTDPQGYKLAVNGTIHSKEVKVDLTGWNDYVFKPSYKLRPLVEVKAYIDQNQHLPEIPSEQEMLKNGLSIGEMVKLQTKKIEELTLYLIEKDKQVSNQNEQLQTQQAQIDNLNRQIANQSQQQVQIDMLKRQVEKLSKLIQGN